MRIFRKTLKISCGEGGGGAEKIRNSMDKSLRFCTKQDSCHKNIRNIRRVVVTLSNLDPNGKTSYGKTRMVFHYLRARFYTGSSRMFNPRCPSSGSDVLLVLNDVQESDQSKGSTSANGKFSCTQLKLLPRGLINVF